MAETIQWEQFVGGDKPPEDQEEGAPKQHQWDTWSQENVVRGMKQDVGMMAATAESAARGTFNNVMNVANAGGEMLGSALAYPTALVRTLGEGPVRNIAGRFNLETGEPLTPAFEDYGVSGFLKNLDKAKNTWPASMLLRGHEPFDSLDAQALVPTAVKSAYDFRAPGEYDSDLVQSMDQSREPDVNAIGQHFAQKRDEALEGYLQRREANPAAADTGDVLADIGSLFITRAPRVASQRLKRLNEAELPPTAVKPKKIDNSVRGVIKEKVEQYKDWFNSSGIKVVEAGAEAAFLSALQDEDPMAAMAVGVGGQTIGNMANHMWKEIPDLQTKPGLVRTGTKFAIAAYGIGALWQVMKSMTPGGRDRILESEESGYDKVAATVAVGALTAMAGYGRPTEKQLNQLGLLVDTWHSSRRGAVASLVSEWANDQSGDIELVWDQISTGDPTYFSEAQLRRLMTGYENQNMGEAIQNLREADREFNRKVNSLRNQAEAAEEVARRLREEGAQDAAGAVPDYIMDQGRALEERLRNRGNQQ